MKNRILGFVLIFIAFSMNANSQTYDEILKTIEENNKDILAGKKLVESKSYEYRLGNLPEGPEVTYGYFPNNSTIPGTKQVFEISQSFQMPCYYRNHKAYANLMISQEEYNQLNLRQNILSEAKSLLIEYVYLTKKLAIADKRLKFASDIYSAYLIRLEMGDANVLEVNKAKLHLMQVQKEEKAIRSEVLTLKERMKTLNGGNDLDISVDQYPLESMLDLDSVLFDKLSKDPELLYSQKAVEASEKQLKVTKNMQLPNFSLGYGTETVADERFQGIMVGVSIPLWSSKRAIQKAKVETEFFDLSNVSLNESKIAETKVVYQQVQTLKESLESYETVLASVNNESLLRESLDSGEMSVIEFFTEMFYYYEIYDDFLSLEKEYYMALSELYRYRL